MGVKRYELSEAQWGKIAPLLHGKSSDPGRTGSDNRLFVNGCLWVLRSGAHWRDLPERYGKWKTVHRRFSRWCHAGVWERVFEALTVDRDNGGVSPMRTALRWSDIAQPALRLRQQETATRLARPNDEACRSVCRRGGVLN